jgi:hypothetical protein
VSLAKATANETLHLVSREMVQLHGGIGMTDEHDAGFYLKRARVLEAHVGQCRLAPRALCAAERLLSFNRHPAEAGSRADERYAP